MKPEAQRIAIAEAHDPRTYKPGTGRIIRGEPIWMVEGSPITCADYPGDLNAMHEAEATLTGETNYYRQLLIRMNNYDGLATVRATAAQRAEAFLRTIGKWQETAPAQK